MQHNGAARNAVLPDNYWRGRQNGDILRELGVSNAEIESLSATARANGEDSLVTYCRVKGLSSLAPLLPQ